MTKGRIGGVLAAFALLLVVALAMGAAYEQIQRHRDRARLPQTGNSIDIGGRSLNIQCSGEGAPAVILESDALKPGYSWLAVQRDLAQTTRTCWYDRAGYGWSDPAPAPHTSIASARDLHELLRAAGVQPPYVLVGDRFGSLNVRVYNGLYPTEVSAAVLVDPVAEDEEQMGVAGRIPFHLGYPPDLVIAGFKRVGIMRLLARGDRRRTVPPTLSPDERATLSGLERLPSLKAAFLAEQGFSSAFEEVRAAGNFGDRPLTVLHSVETAMSDRPQSTRERQLVVKDSAQDVLAESPGAIAAAVRDLLGDVR